MRRRNYFVVRDHGEWKVYLEGDYSNANADKEVVITAAVEAAYLSGGHGYEAAVFVADENHQFHRRWTYGRDPYPIVAL